jgi:hypothetical protein
VIRLRDGLGLVQFLSTAVPRLAAEIPRIAVIQLRDEITVEHFPLKGRDDVASRLVPYASDSLRSGRTPSMSVRRSWPSS